MDTPAGSVPRVSTKLGIRDLVGTMRVRLGFYRSGYKVIPGLYCVGNPCAESPVLVTANYKLSFDSLRQVLGGIDAWILVVDTRGINVWCAAGKKSFSTKEVAYQVQKTRLAEVVSHRKLILPQLAATGVSARELKKISGFQGQFGPIRAVDLPLYLKKQPDEAMRLVTFSMAERLVLVPVEISLIWKLFAIICLVAVIISGIGPWGYSLKMAGQRGLLAVGATIMAVLTGAAAVPIFLPWLPGRQFWIKGIITGVLGWLALLYLKNWQYGVIESAVLLCWITSISSYMAMNFTGSTPFTSLSGVKYEMRRGLMFQCIGATIATILWFVNPFLAG